MKFQPIAGSFFPFLQLTAVKNPLKLCCRYHVIPDPDGPKIGNGGSTLFVLEKLTELYPQEDLDKSTNSLSLFLALPFSH
jgi:hypothetical protein